MKSESTEVLTHIQYEVKCHTDFQRSLAIFNRFLAFVQFAEGCRTIAEVYRVVRIKINRFWIHFQGFLILFWFQEFVALLFSCFGLRIQLLLRRWRSRSLWACTTRLKVWKLYLIFFILLDAEYKYRCWFEMFFFLSLRYWCVLGCFFCGGTYSLGNSAVSEHFWQSHFDRQSCYIIRAHFVDTLKALDSHWNLAWIQKIEKNQNLFHCIQNQSQRSSS